MKGRNKNKKNRKGQTAYNKKELSSGMSDHCICIKCSYTSIKKRGIPCMEEKCPTCGAVLLREGGYHYQKAKGKTKQFVSS